MRNPVTPRVVEIRDRAEMQDYISEYVFSLLNAPKPPYTVTCAAIIKVLRAEGTVDV